MQLDDTQRQQVAQWIRDGLKLSEIQNKIAADFGLCLTYMETRFLVDDLKLVPKDPEPPKAPTPPPETPQPPAPGAALPAAGPDEAEPELPAEPPVGGGNVVVAVDAVARPGALVSGSVTFSDGQPALWWMDESGRLGIAPKVKGYRPSETDIGSFQFQLQRELQTLGF